MKELQEFTQWTDSVINEFVATGSKTKSQGEKQNNIPVELKRDIMTQAQRKYPSYNPQQALALYMSDRLEDFEERDFQQNKIINTQRRENDSLRKELTTLSREVDDVEDISRKDHAEVERLKATSGQIRSDIESKKISREEVANILNQVQDLRSKGISGENYQELRRQVDRFKTDSVDPKKFQEFKNNLDLLNKQRKVEDGDFRKLQDLAKEVELGQKQVATGKQDVAQKLEKLDQEQKILKHKSDNLGRVVSDKVRSEVDKVTRGMERKSPTKRIDKLLGKNDENLSDIISIPSVANNLKQRIDAIEPEVSLTKTMAGDVGDEVDQVIMDLEKEKEINRQQSLQINRLEVARAEEEVNKKRRTRVDRSSRQNPYANLADDEPNSSSDRRPPRQNPYANLANELRGVRDQLKTDDEPNSSSDRRPPKTGDLFEQELDDLVNNILGPQYSKYLK